MALADKVKSLAIALSDLERASTASGSDAARGGDLTARGRGESARRERQRRARAAPRVSQARSVARSPTSSSRRDTVAAKLETCVVALQNIKLDLIRLNAGQQTPQHITSLAMDALNLADSVDSALYVVRRDANRPERARRSRPAAR